VSTRLLHYHCVLYVPVKIKELQMSRLAHYRSQSHCTSSLTVSSGWSISHDWHFFCINTIIFFPPLLFSFYSISNMLYPHKIFTKIQHTPTGENHLIPALQCYVPSVCMPYLIDNIQNHSEHLNYLCFVSFTWLIICTF
jgi:hypothetical protein